MDRPKKQPRFEIQPVIEQRPFENPAVQSFFTKWCDINDDSIELHIPKDLQIWEMIELVNTIDNETFAAKPERQTEAKEKLLELAKTFQNSGIYIAQRLDEITDGREIAESLAKEFYEYGQSLTSGKRPDTPPSIADIAAQNLTPEETETVDRFLAGDNLYESRQKSVEQTIDDHSKKDELYETARSRTISQFFRVTEKSFALESKNEELQQGPTQLKPWQNDKPIHSTFLAKIEKSMTQNIETPKREIGSAVFRRGLEKLTNEMQFDQQKLVDSLHITELRAELDAIRQTGDLAKISQKEEDIADKIQSAVSKIPYHLDTNNPTEIIATQRINCVGASILGGALMKKVGLNYLVGHVPEHSILFLVNSSGEVEWRDMMNKSFNEKLTAEMIEGRKKDDTLLTVKDIVEFSQNPTPQGLMFDIKGDEYRNKLPWVKEGQRQNVTVFEPEYGQQVQLLNNAGADINNNEEAIEAYQEAIAIDPNYTDAYSNLSHRLNRLDRNEEAIESSREAIAIDPKDALPYTRLGTSFNNLGRYEESIEVSREAIAIDPKDAYPYSNLSISLNNLGLYEKGVEAYQKFIDLAK